MRILSFILVVLVWALVPASAQIPVQIVALGHGLFVAPRGPSPDGYAEQLERALGAKGHCVAVINAGVRGDTTAGVLRRFYRDVPEETDIVILAIGANDLRAGVSPETVRAHTQTIVDGLRAKGAEVIEIGPSADSMIVRAMFDRTLVRPKRLPRDQVALDQVSRDGATMVVGWTLPAVEAAIARVQERRSRDPDSAPGREVK